VRGDAGIKTKLNFNSPLIKGEERKGTLGGGGGAGKKKIRRRTDGKISSFFGKRSIGLG